MIEREIRLAICVPSHITWDDTFGQCLSKLLMFCAQHPFPGHGNHRGVFLYTRKSSGISLMREGFFQDAIERKDTHVLMLDSDQTFPPDTAHRLLQHDKLVVAANVATKTLPSGPTARYKSDKPWGEPCYSNGKHDLEKVWRVGGAVMLVDTRALPTLGEGLFEWIWQPEIKQYRGEDWSFCKRCEEKGVDIYVDHDLSNQVGHIGQYIYTHRDVMTPERLKAVA